jgi:hypothetical protein
MCTTNGKFGIPGQQQQPAIPAVAVLPPSTVSETGAPLTLAEKQRDAIARGRAQLANASRARV